jgi:hypothetical protein
MDLMTPTTKTLSASEKAAATRQRRMDEERDDKFTQIRAQVADGTLVIRQMTGAEHKTALRAAVTRSARTTRAV